MRTYRQQRAALQAAYDRNRRKVETLYQTRKINFATYDRQLVDLGEKFVADMLALQDRFGL